ncbi:MAG: arylesterase, partial [Planctomycetes bacterium]|nr:arylesterase [Planctomycetota bacterium]
ITAGYGLGSEEAFPALTETRLNESGYSTRVINAGTSGDTSTGGLNKMDWLLQNRVDILVLELGGNDGLRGIDLSLTRANISEIVDRTLQSWPDAQIVIAGMQVPPNLGHEYTREFKEIFPAVAAEYDADLIPFLLEGVGGIRRLNLADGIHPTAEGHQIVSELVYATLEPIVRALSKN